MLPPQVLKGAELIMNVARLPWPSAAMSHCHCRCRCHAVHALAHHYHQRRRTHESPSRRLDELLDTSGLKLQTRLRKGNQSQQGAIIAGILEGVAFLFLIGLLSVPENQILGEHCQMQSNF